MASREKLMIPCLEKDATVFPGRLYHLFMHIGKILRDKTREKMSEYNLQHAQARVLNALVNGSLTQKELVKKLNLSRSGTTQLLKRMETQQFITRIRPKENMRIVNVSLTPKGEALVSKIHEIWLEIEAEIQKDFDDEEVDIINDFLLIIRNKFIITEE
ncbi:MarR family transcriptional regulator [Lentisphaerota bacterium WC36G]|nr:MarR family transcriptional regulator [Lentisphaerae bacterium WC36]